MQFLALFSGVYSRIFFSHFCRLWWPSGGPPGALPGRAFLASPIGRSATDAEPLIHAPVRSRCSVLLERSQSVLYAELCTKLLIPCRRGGVHATVDQPSMGRKRDLFITPRQSNSLTPDVSF